MKHLGEITIAHLNLADDNITIIVKFVRTRDLAKGEMIHLSANPADLHIFDEEGIALLT